MYEWIIGSLAVLDQAVKKEIERRMRPFREIFPVPGDGYGSIRTIIRVSPSV